jgi:3-methyl-2-oxobutanoate hydroxymethyltransferase
MNLTTARISQNHFKLSGVARMQDKDSGSSNTKRLTIKDIVMMKHKLQKISVLTAYDYSTASICDRAGVDILLVGDSAGMVMLGYPTTNQINMEEMLTFCSAVSRGAKRAMIIADMPFGSYQASISEAIANAVKFIKVGCHAVKLEGGIEVIDTIKAIVNTGIPVMGHIGLKPQTTNLWEGYSLQGKTKISGLKLIEDAKALEEAGVFSIVLEMVTSEVADIICKSISIPTIGIGSGSSCDGQVLVLHDLLGIYQDIKPKFVKRYAELSKSIFEAVSVYINDVKSSKFPEEENVFHICPSDLEELSKMLKEKKN